MPSTAFVSLMTVRLAEVRELIGLRPSDERFPAAESRGAVNRAAVVLLCAHLEGFLEDLVGELIDQLNSSAPRTENVPLRLRAAHVTIEIDAIAAMTDPTARAERMQRLFRDHSDLWLAETLTSQLRVERVTAGMSNPGAPEISRLFESVGLENVLDEVALTDGSDPAKRVNEFVGVRNSIAHGEGTKVTDDQVDRYLDAIECLGRSLDSAVARHVQSITGSPTLPWS
jgi:hypothetical protein